jgi:hypothetical protein
VGLAIAVQTFDHKESCSGSRGIDYSKATEVAVTLTFDFENFSKENVGMATVGESLELAAGTVTDQPVKLFEGLWQAMPHVAINTVVVTSVDGATTYTEDTDYVVNPESGSIMGVAGGAIDAAGVDVLVDYAFAKQDKVEALTNTSSPDRYFRFEGLNTAGDVTKPVIIDLFKVNTQPLADWALVNDELASGSITAKVLSDPSRTSGSKFFTVRSVK